MSRLKPKLSAMVKYLSIPAQSQSNPADVPKWSNDPIRLYLGQMAEIPLLAREEEVSLAKKIEMTRKRFRRTVLGCHLGARNAFSILAKVHKAILPFDRTIKVSLTERLTKEQVLARMPHNLRTLDHLLEVSRQDFAYLIRKGTDRRKFVLLLARRFLRRRRKILGPPGGTESSDASRPGDDASDGGRVPAAWRSFASDSNC